jgi:hypothetical protein
MIEVAAGCQTAGKGKIRNDWGSGHNAEGQDTVTATTQAEQLVRPIVDRPLTEADRCDRCGAQAFLRAEFPDGSDLLFCGHHGREYAPVLAAQGAHVVDETDRINESPSPSANHVG